MRSNTGKRLTTRITDHVQEKLQVAAEVKLGTRSILEYLLSPVQQAFHESGRER